MRNCKRKVFDLLSEDHKFNPNSATDTRDKELREQNWTCSLGGSFQLQDQSQKRWPIGGIRELTNAEDGR